MKAIPAMLAAIVLAGCESDPRPDNYRGDGKGTERLEWLPRTQGVDEIVIAPDFAGSAPLIVTRIAE